MEYILRNYQKEAVEAGVKFLKSDAKHGAVIVAPTGCGKSIIIADICHKIGGKTLILQPSQEVLMSNYEKMITYVDKSEIGIFSASCGRKDIGRITYATVGSIIKKKEMFSEFNHLLIDECHLVNSKGGMYQELIDYMGGKLIGLTATPYRLHSYADISGNRSVVAKFLTRTRPRIFKEIIHITQIGDLYKQGFLCPIRYGTLGNYNHSEIKLNTTGMDYDQKALEAYNKKKKVVDVVKSAIIHHESRHVLVFTASVKEAEELRDKLNLDGVNSETISAKTPKKDRAEILERFKNGEIKVVTNVGTMTCVSDDTEILTRRGWSNIDDISIDDNVAQYDNGEITFSKPFRIIKKEIEKGTKLAEVNGPFVSIKTTLDHDILYKTFRKGQFKKEKAHNLINRAVFIPVSGNAKEENMEVVQKVHKQNKGRFLAVNSYMYRKNGLSKNEAKDLALKNYEIKHSLKYKNPNELTLDECRFIGFWIGDGTKCRDRNNGIRYSLCQTLKNPKMLEWINNVLNSCDIHYTLKDYDPPKNNIINGRVCNIGGHRKYYLSMGTGGNKQKVNGLYHLLPYLQKDGTDLFWGLTSEQFYCIMEGYWKANGCHGNNKDMDGSASVCPSEKFVNLLQSIGVCRGFRVTVKKIKKDIYHKVQLYKISLTKKTKHQLTNKRFQIETVGRNDMRVWCVTMPKGTIVTRCNGTVTIMGNCGYDFPALDTIVLARPTQSVALYYQMVGRAMRPHPSKQFAKVFDCCGNVARFGKIATFEIVEVKPGLHRMKSDKNFLTGWDFVSNRDIEATNYKGLKESRWNDNAVIIQFGKYKGQHISKLPTSYLEWCTKTFDKGIWYDKFKAELDRRESLNYKKREELVLPFVSQYEENFTNY